MNCTDDTTCKDAAMQQIRQYCEHEGLRLTPTRQQVLALIWASHSPIKAYDLLTKLQEKEPTAKPPTVYRALAFLEQHRFIHKLHTLNAYIGCHAPDTLRHCFFFICSQCNTVSEQCSSQYQALIESEARQITFDVKHAALEISGMCNHCA